MEYIGSDQTKKHFVHQVSETTGELHAKEWLETIRENRQYVKKYGWACETFQGTGKRKASVVMGVSPAIKKQVPLLRKLQSDPDFILIGISSGLKFCYESGIVPHYCFVAEVQPVVLKWFEDLPEAFMRGITLIVDIHTNPKVMDVWKGKISFLGTYSVEKNVDKKAKKWLYPVNGIDRFFPALGAQHGSATAFANIVLESPAVIFVGSEFGFPSNDPVKDKYYANRTDEKDHWERMAHTDIYGNVAYTTFALLQNKYILEDWCGKMAGMSYFLNATEAGIFGVTGHGDKAAHLPWITPIRLDMAIKQAKSILYYGTPITTDTKPKERSTVQRDGVKAPFQIQLGG
jgi:hypothetical protein